MRLDISTPVRYPDGEQAGMIDKVLVDFDHGVVREIVLETPDWAGRMVLVPIDLVHEDPGAILTLGTNRDAVAALPDFEISRYMALPADQEPGADQAPPPEPTADGTTPAAALDADEDAATPPPIPPEDWAPAGNYMRGEDLFPPTTPYNMVPVFEESNAEDGAIALGQSTEVYCSDGRVGVIDAILVDDESATIGGFVIRQDDPAAARLLIALDLIAAADAQLVQLDCTLEALAEQAEEYIDPVGEPEPETLLPSN